VGVPIPLLISLSIHIPSERSRFLAVGDLKLIMLPRYIPSPLPFLHTRCIAI
jgi:hypothetical protein